MRDRAFINDVNAPKAHTTSSGLHELHYRRLIVAPDNASGVTKRQYTLGKTL